MWLEEGLDPSRGFVVVFSNVFFLIIRLFDISKQVTHVPGGFCQIVGLFWIQFFTDGLYKMSTALSISDPNQKVKMDMTTKMISPAPGFDPMITCFCLQNSSN